MKRSIVAILSSGALLTTLAGGAFLASCNQRGNYEGVDGETLYKRACLSCHGKDGRAMAGGAPSYRGIRKDWDEEKLLGYIDNPQRYKRANRPPRLGKRYMPPVDRRMPEDARRRLIAHVLGLMDALEVPSD
ncbi:MAG: c-type cytochrome [Planctomycetota bacterium]